MDPLTKISHYTLFQLSHTFLFILFQVEEILGRKSESGQVYYRIKWSGYSSQYNTWEPEENLANCRDLIEEFMEKDTSKVRERESLGLAKCNVPSRILL